MRRCRVNIPNRCYHLISCVAHRAFSLDDGERTRLAVRRVKIDDPSDSEFSVSEIRAHKGRGRADKEGGATMRSNAYCGNLLWQSSLTLLGPCSAVSQPNIYREHPAASAADIRIVY